MSAHTRQETSELSKRKSIPPEMVQTLTLFLTRLKCLAKWLTKRMFQSFTARRAVDDVGESACEIMPNNEIGFRSGNRLAESELKNEHVTTIEVPGGRVFSGISGFPPSAKSTFNLISVFRYLDLFDM